MMIVLEWSFVGMIIWLQLICCSYLTALIINQIYKMGED